MIDSLLNLQIPLPENISSKRSNCFNAVIFFHKDTQELEFCGPEEFVQYIQKAFEQIGENHRNNGTVCVVWSRSSKGSFMKKVNLSELKKDTPGYPFGLVIEHAFVILGEKTVFQKRDPSGLGPYEIIQFEKAIKPYLEKFGYEVIFHKKKAL